MHRPTKYLIYIFSIIFFLTANNQTISQGLAGYPIDSLNQVDSLVVDSLNTLSFNFRGSNPVEGIRIGTKALELAEELKYSKGMMEAASFIGVNYRNIGDYSSAVKYYLLSFNMADSLDDKVRKGYGLNNIGNLYYKMGRDSLALSTLFEALKIANEIDHDDIKAYCYINVGRIYTNIKKFDIALEYYSKALVIRRKLGNAYSICQSLLDIADLHRELNEYDLALNYYDEAILISKDAIGVSEILSNIYFGKGLVYRDKKNYQTSNKYLHKAIETYELINQRLEAIDVYMFLARNYSDLNDYKKALYYSNKYTEFKEKIFDQEISKQAARLGIQFDNERKEKANELLRKDNAIKELQLENQRYILVSLTILVLLLVIFGIIFYFRYKAKKRINDELVEKNKTIEEQSEKLGNLNATKDKFFSIIAHDLRNPFMNLINSSGLLVDDYYKLDDIDKLTLLKSMNSSATKNYTLLENLLTWASSQRGYINFTPTTFNITKKIEDNIKLFNDAAASKDITLSLHLPRNYNVYADENMVDTILRNLLSNAIKFTPHNGEVITEHDIIDNKIKINVTDKGVGIPEERIKNLFKLEGAESTTGTQGEAGSGLGLILCKEFIELNNGDIGVTSIEGKGSTFWFSLPLVS